MPLRNPARRITGLARALGRTAYRSRRQIATAVRTMVARINPRPILIFGNHKSGTTVIAALLGEMTGLSVTLDLVKEVTHPTYHRVRTGERPIEAFVRHNKLGFCRDIVKEPNLLVVYDEIVSYFPESKKVFLVRDPRDNIRSILNRLKFPGHLDQLDHPYEGINARAWNLYLDGSWLGLEGENYIEVLAARWNLAVGVYQANHKKMSLLRYEDFTKDKVGEIVRLAKILGLPRRHDITDKVDIQYQPRGDRNVKWRDFFGDRNLERIERICAGGMIRFGYHRVSTGRIG